MLAPARLPPPVTPGDRVGVAALSGPVDPERLERGLRALGEVGFTPVPARNLHRRAGPFAGTEDERLEAFHELVADHSLKAILFARGGHGVLRLLPRLDWELLAARPRAYVGYSDLTPFLLAVVHRLGLAAFHGPMVAADLARGLAAAETTSLLDALAGRLPRQLPVAEVRGEGAAAGVLLGGCLSLLVSTLGTAWAPDLEGAILLWEDVHEPLYRLDRMLTHMELSSTLGGIRAMIVGHLEDGDKGGGGGGEAPTAQALVEGLGWQERLARPVAWGLAAGHRAPNRTLPLGLRARLEPEQRRLVVGLHEEVE